MSYIAPYISPAGLVIPGYQDIVSDLVAQFTSIYGSTTYLQPDSSDYQMLSVFAAKVNDVFLALQLAYNARSPLTAIGADLDAVIKLNGLARAGATFSTCPITLTGAAKAVVTNGSIKDQVGNSWTLPSPVTIGPNGSVTVTATCATPGPISAAAGTITSISTPTAGWTSVTNASNTTTGQLTEPDSSLRSRQAISVALPSITMLQGTIAAIAATSGVTRFNVLENPTGATDSYGNPPHSITCVVEGGTDLAVATSIYQRRGIGCFTHGTTTVSVVDLANGSTTPIGFDRPTYVPIFVLMTVHGLSGFTSQTNSQIQAAVAAYLNTLQIGESVTTSALYGAALSVMPNLSLPAFSIRSLTAGTSSGSLSTNDIALTFSQVAQGVMTNVTITTV